jgi:hypothetical protein
MLFAKAHKRVPKLRPVQLFGELIHWAGSERYLGVILDTHLTWLPHTNQVRKKAVLRLGVLDLLLKRSVLSMKKDVCCIRSSSRHRWTTETHLRSFVIPMPGSCRCLSVQLGTLARGKVTMILDFHQSPSTSELYLRV